MPCRSSQPCFGMVRNTRRRWCRDSSDGWNGTSARVSTRCAGRPAWSTRLIAPRSSARTTYVPFTAGPRIASECMGRSLEYNATIVGRTDLTDTLSTFLIQLDQPPRKHPWFTAGQYCVLGLDNSERPDLG